MPRDHREGDVLLGVQIETWRIAYRRSELDAGLVERLAQLGMEWEPREKGWQNTWEAIATYARHRRHLLPRRDETIIIHGTAHPIGRIRTDCRRPSFAATWPTRIEALDELRAPWRVPGGWDAAWQRHLVLVDLYLDDGGTITELLSGGAGGGGVRYGGEDLTRWLTRQHQRWPQLKAGQRELLDLRGLSPEEAEVKAAPRRRRSRQERFQNLLDAARQHIQHIGPLTDQHGRHTVHADWRVTIDGIDVRLLQRLNTARQRRTTLTTQQLAALAQLGLPWALQELTDRGTA